MTKPTDWQILAVALMRRLDNRVELSWEEVAEARQLLDPVENETVLISYQPPWALGAGGVVELRTRPRTVAGALDALVDELRETAPLTVRCITSFPQDGGAVSRQDLEDAGFRVPPDVPEDAVIRLKIVERGDRIRRDDSPSAH